MDAKEFVSAIREKLEVGFFTGVPDSLLRPLCDVLMEEEGVGCNHVIAADEGGSVGLAAGHYLATGKPGVVYMQNSGIGNAVNPICSLINDKVYAIPMLFVVGWRGEPGVHDEPQHVFQGEISLPLLECLDLETMVFAKDTTVEDLSGFFASAKKRFEQGKSSALLVQKGALTYGAKCDYSRTVSSLTREEAVEAIIDAAESGTAFVSTTGKLSRELFELREARNEGHGADFLTVGSMGHSSMIGLGVALAKPEKRVMVLDGDGALLMHTGALAIVASRQPEKFVHVLINNEAHETVGGMPTVSPGVDYRQLALAAGYKEALLACTIDELGSAIQFAQAAQGPIFVEVRTNTKSRSDLGRPTTTAYENGRSFMEFLEEER